MLHDTGTAMARRCTLLILSLALILETHADELDDLLLELLASDESDLPFGVHFEDFGLPFEHADGDEIGSVPKSIGESLPGIDGAGGDAVDGASRFRVWWEIIIPQIRPGLAALAIFTFPLISLGLGMSSNAMLDTSPAQVYFVPNRSVNRWLGARRCCASWIRRTIF